MMRLVDVDTLNVPRFVPGSHGQNVPSTCTIVIIAGINDTDKTIYTFCSIQVGTLTKWTG